MTKIFMFWLASLIFVSFGAFAAAQTRLPEPRILSGNDIGFQVERTDVNGKPIGKWMLRFNGQWTELGTQPTVHPLKVK